MRVDNRITPITTNPEITSLLKTTNDDRPITTSLYDCSRKYILLCIIL